MTVGIYIRVSTEEQAKEGYSIPAQKERLKAHCVSQGWPDYKFYIDAGVSAKDLNRPKLKLLMDHIKEGRIKTLLVYRLDRLTRSVRDLYNLLEFLDKYHCAFKSATEQYDTTNAMGRMFIGLVALLAQWERENLSERTRMGLEERVSGGERVGGTPYGFDMVEGKLIQNKEETLWIKKIIDLLKSGKSVNAIAKYLTKTNDDKAIWHPQAIFRIIRNPALYGSSYWSGKVYDHTHDDQAIISKNEFDKLQVLLVDRSQQRLREVKSTYLFQGVLSCHVCNRPLSVNRYVRKSKDGSQYQNAIYKCQACYKDGKNIIQIGEYRFLEALYDYMQNVEITQFEIPLEEEDDAALYKKQLQQIEKQREKYQRAWAADKMLDDEFDRMMDETKDTMKVLQEKISEIQKPMPAIDIEEIKNTIFYFNENFKRLTDEEKREFVARFIRRIEYKLITQPPKRPDRHKKGKDLVVITNVLFY